MIDKELLADVAGVISLGEAVLSQVEDNEAAVFIEKASRAFLKNSDANWWWEALSCNSVAIDYGPDNGLALLRRLVLPSAVVRLVVTDDSSGPWPVFSGDIANIISLLENLYFFEYFVIESMCDWIIFDTHQNQLIVAGSLVEKAAELS